MQHIGRDAAGGLLHLYMLMHQAHQIPFGLVFAVQAHHLVAPAVRHGAIHEDLVPRNAEAPVESPAVWVMALRRLMTDDALCERLRSGARQWVEQNFNAHTNAARLYSLYERAIAAAQPKP